MHRPPPLPYDVGYREPPKATRWKKGQSGNPRGRPKAKPDPVAEQLVVLQEKVSAVIDGEAQMVTRQTALILKLREAALRGEVWAQKLCEKLAQHFPPPPAIKTASVEEILAHATRAMKEVTDEK